MDAKKKKGGILAILLVLLVVGFGGYHFYEQKKAEEAAKTLTLSGNVDVREISLAFRESDRIADIYVDEGDRVQKGRFWPVSMIRS